MLTRLSLVIDSSCQVIWILTMLHMKTFFPWRKRWSKEKRGKPIRDRSCSRKWTLASRLSHIHTQSVGCVNICLEQWFSTFFSTGPHFGQSASLTGSLILVSPLTNLSILMLNFTELMAADDYLYLILPKCLLNA